MKLDEMIIRALELELEHHTRDERRGFNKALAEAKWLVAYPISSNTTPLPSEWVFDRITFVFSNNTPTFRPRGFIDGISEFSICDDTYWASWKEIAVHMSGTIWIETSKITPSHIEPIPFKHLDTLPVLGYHAVTEFHEAITSYMGVGEDYELDAVLEKYLESLKPEELSLPIVFDDVEQRNWYEYGKRTVRIEYFNEIIGYAEFSGRELLGKKFFTTDIKKYQAALKDIVDKSGVYDKMAFNGVTVITDEDADAYVGVPDITPLKFT